MQGFWRHQVLRGVGWGSRRYSALEGHGNQYWPIHLSMPAQRTPLPDREAWQATVHRVATSQTGPKLPCAHGRKIFFACGSSAPVRVEHEGSAAARLAGTLAAPSVQRHRLPPPPELWPSQSFFQPLVAGDQKASLASLSLQLRPFRHLEGILPGVLLCCLAHQAHRGAPRLGSYSVDQHIRHLKEHRGWGPTL